MINLHTHSLLSDGVLLPSELIRRAEDKDNKVIAITDHIGISNLDEVVPQVVKACKELNRFCKIMAIPGAEITHVPPPLIGYLVRRARELGALLVLVHGETIVEPVLPGTNRAALEAKIDILAHPGLITEEEVFLARRNGVFLELNGRKGHCLTNGYLAALALKLKVDLVFNTDAHAPEDIWDSSQTERAILGTGLSRDSLREVLNNSEKIVQQLKLKVNET